MTAADLEYFIYEYDTMEVDCSKINTTGNFKEVGGEINSPQTVAILVELYEMTYCSVPDGFFPEDDAYFFDEVREHS